MRFGFSVCDFIVVLQHQTRPAFGQRNVVVHNGSYCRNRRYMSDCMRSIEYNELLDDALTDRT
jgi:hypothetical protein